MVFGSGTLIKDVHRKGVALRKLNYSYRKGTENDNLATVEAEF